MAARKKQPTKDLIRVSSFSLTPATEHILRRLSQGAGDYIGRGVSSSAVVRALVIYANQQSLNWIHETLFPLIEQEIMDGILWGKRRVSKLRVYRE